jgi:zinc transport system permease protein
LLAHFFPDFFRARGLSERSAHFAFDLLIAAALALATMSIGVMGAFALIFLPPLIAFAWTRTWRSALLLAVGVGVVCHVLAFTLALLLDQPYGPLLGLLLVIVAAASALSHAYRHRPLA